jgi:hypothetical protein
MCASSLISDLNVRKSSWTLNIYETSNAYIFEFFITSSVLNQVKNKESGVKDARTI